MLETQKIPYALGIDVGSTTVKTVLLTEEGEVLSSSYERHFSKVRETVCAKLAQLAQEYPDRKLRVSITGSAGLGLAQAAELPFVQEVHAAFLAVKQRYPQADVVIELGGEDAKIIFLTGGVEQRMNGSCAGGTGAFIDQMATLLDVSVDQLDKMALAAEKVYPIASRCGVFAKSDIQPLLNQGARREDIAASIFQAVVDQTVSGLAQGRRISGNVLFLGGPLSFLQGLRNAFTKTLELDEEHALFPEDGRTFVAYGSAVSASSLTDTYTLNELEEMLRNAKTQTALVADKPLFSYPEEYQRFRERHAAHDVARGDYRTYAGKAYLGIDAGSTTTKIVLLSENHELLYEFYASNKGQPLDCIQRELSALYEGLSPDCTICGSAVTGYGEDLIRAGLGVDFGIVETVAHFKAASFFCPEVDFIIDIGGQDIKCFQIKNHSIDSIMLNEACSSGCGSFIQAFAVALGYDIADFSRLGLFAEHPVDLGSRCTVFMNSSVKQAQKDGATVEDISAGLSGSIVKNAIYKVIRAHNPEELGQHIVVQGGTFLNDAILRSFEMEIGRNVTRPVISGLMGAYGAALHAMANEKETSSLISLDELKNFTHKTTSVKCGMCTNHCSLTVSMFPGGRKFISGNRCERPLGGGDKLKLPNLYEYKLNRLQQYRKSQPGKAKIGIPFGLNMFELLPFWHTFLTHLDFEVVLSDVSTRAMYAQGQNSIPSDTVCYPAKLMHGHIENLLSKGVDAIFYPCMTYNLDEHRTANCYNCPVVAYYPELLKANMSHLQGVDFMMPYIELDRKKDFLKTACALFVKKYPHINKKMVKQAAEAGYAELDRYYADIAAQGKEAIAYAEEHGLEIAVLAGRPYHIDPEINHGIDRLIQSYNMVIVSEDSVAPLAEMPTVNVLNQWTYHSRMYAAANWAVHRPDAQLIQLVSFGCGIDAVTTDEMRAITEEGGKIYTQLKIDEINNLGAAKIRIRSMLAAVEEGKQNAGNA